MNDCISMTALAHMPDKLCLWDKLYKKRAISLLLPFKMSGFRHRNPKNKTESKGGRCFYLNTGSDHCSTTHKILLPPGGSSYSAEVTWVYHQISIYLFLIQILPQQVEVLYFVLLFFVFRFFFCSREAQ